MTYITDRLGCLTKLMIDLLDYKAICSLLNRLDIGRNTTILLVYRVPRSLKEDTPNSSV